MNGAAVYVHAENAIFAAENNVVHAEARKKICGHTCVHPQGAGGLRTSYSWFGACSETIQNGIQQLREKD